ncbi:hypothetical protein AgCh_025596 [Apium graveolens]
MRHWHYGLCCLPYIIDVLYALVDQVEPEITSLALRHASDLAVSIESMLSTYSHENDGMMGDNHEMSSDFRLNSPLVFNESMLEKVLRKLESGLQHLGYHLSVRLVWTAFGGEVQFVEATSMTGKGDMHLTGQLGDVIKESAHIALTWVRSRATELKFSATKEINLLEGRDVHIHFPAGAIPKDGPSASVTLLTALVLLFSQIKVKSDTTITREMTLQGLVLPVGGVKDKEELIQDLYKSWKNPNMGGTEVHGGTIRHVHINTSDRKKTFVILSSE